MIQGMHGLVFTSEATAAREFIRDKLDLDYVDAGDGWLVFDVPEAELGVHPVEGDAEGFHELTFWCDDIEATVEELESRGVTFDEPIEDAGFGLTTAFTLPGDVPVGLYEPRHEQP